MNFHRVEIMWHGVIYLLLWSSSLLSYPSPYFSCLSLLLLSSYLLTQDYFLPSQTSLSSLVWERTHLYQWNVFSFFVLFLKTKHLIIEGYLSENRLFVLRLKRCHKNLWLFFAASLCYSLGVVQPSVVQTHRTRRGIFPSDVMLQA